MYGRHVFRRMLKCTEEYELGELVEGIGQWPVCVSIVIKFQVP
jgi:hypothetical protein